TFYRFFIEKYIMINMPDGVPPQVSNSFIALIPGAVILLLFWIIRHVIGFDLNGFLSTLLMPLKGILDVSRSPSGLRKTTKQSIT
ncbi:PTS transporter subunit EIIC, partial [Enterococcus faecalis]|uniref:PTS transporter subunit EIIC n=1 Tax=Enterococcus faecalis TaxID=1351 RepID=UPI003D6A5DA7